MKKHILQHDINEKYDTTPPDSTVAPGYRRIAVQIKGPEIHLANACLADPRNAYAQAMAAIRAKGAKKRTESDNEQNLFLQARGSLYVDMNDQVCIPSRNIEAMLLEAAKKYRMGSKFKQGVEVPGDAYLLDYAGRPKRGSFDLDAIVMAAERFSVVLIKGSSNSRVPSALPKFSMWSLDFFIDFSPEQTSFDEIKSALMTAGKFLGFGGRRPRSGRFVVERFEEIA